MALSACELTSINASDMATESPPCPERFRKLTYLRSLVTARRLWLQCEERVMIARVRKRMKGGR